MAGSATSPGPTSPSASRATNHGRSTDPVRHVPPPLARARGAPFQGTRMTRAIVTDIEGTTSSISFVRDVLFPYARRALRSEEHTSELQSRENLVCRLRLE